MRAALGGLAAVVALVVAGCAPGAAFDEATTYQCLHHTIDADVLAAATPVTEITGAPATMLAEAVHDDGSPLMLADESDWYLAGHTDDSVLIMRTLTRGEAAGYGLPRSDREIIEVTRIEGSQNLADGWYVTSNGACPLTIDLGDLSVPTVTLDPAHTPEPAATELQLLVTESACNSGQPATGRVELVSLVETEDSVTVTIGVKPKSGFANCPSNPATPFTVTLEEPIGDRTLIDGTRGAPLETP